MVFLQDSYGFYQAARFTLKVLLILYAGEDDDSSTKAAILRVAPHLTLRGTFWNYHDVLRDEVFGPMVEMAMEGNLMAIVGGTWSSQPYDMGPRKECQE